MQKRILFFVFDGTGLGHLRRIGRIAEALQGPCATLVMTGMREAAWIIPDVCEVVSLPRGDRMRPTRPGFTPKFNWLDHHDPIAPQAPTGAHALHSSKLFEPQAIFVDYLPFGKREELVPVLAATVARKYFILRGIVDASDQSLLCGQTALRLGEAYDRILITADPRIVNVVQECGYDRLTEAKVTYTGYVMPEAVDQQAVRSRHDVPNGCLWVVCSGGGGIYAERLLNRCIKVAAEFPEVIFDVVLGPFGDTSLFTGPRSANCRFHVQLRDLPDLHAAADVVISAGGYNTLVEAASGGARLLVSPSRTGQDDEQQRQATLMASYYPVELIASLHDLEPMLRLALGKAFVGPRPRFVLEASGLQRIRELLLEDLA